MDYNKTADSQAGLVVGVHIAISTEVSEKISEMEQNDWPITFSFGVIKFQKAPGSANEAKRWWMI